VALDPFFIRHATEARHDAMFSALVTLATIVAFRRGPTAPAAEENEERAESPALPMTSAARCEAGREFLLTLL